MLSIFVKKITAKVFQFGLLVQKPVNFYWLKTRIVGKCKMQEYERNFRILLHQKDKIVNFLNLRFSTLK